MDLTEGWLLVREITDQQSKRGSSFARSGTVDDVRVLTQDASVAHAALDAAEESKRTSKLGYLIAAVALALAFASLIGTIWPTHFGAKRTDSAAIPNSKTASLKVTTCPGGGAPPCTAPTVVTTAVPKNTAPSLGAAALALRGEAGSQCLPGRPDCNVVPRSTGDLAAGKGHRSKPGARSKSAAVRSIHGAGKASEDDNASGAGGADNTGRDQSRAGGSAAIGPTGSGGIAPTTPSSSGSAIASIGPSVVVGPTAATTAGSSPVGIGAPHACSSKFYPEAAQRLHEEGTTTVTFTVTADGDVANPAIATSSGHSDLDQAALPCVMTWKYKPAIQAGKPVTAQWTANVVWKADAARSAHWRVHIPFIDS